VQPAAGIVFPQPAALRKSFEDKDSLLLSFLGRLQPTRCRRHVMTHATIHHGTVEAPIHGINAALRCVTGAARGVRESLSYQRPSKRLDSAHRFAASSAAMSDSSDFPTQAQPSLPKAAPAPTRMPPATTLRGLDPVAPRATAADLDLPAAVWATLVVVRATSA